MDEVGKGVGEEVGRWLQESTGPQIRDKAGLAPRIYDLVSVSLLGREKGE